MRAFARVVAERDGLGGTRLTVLRSESPLLLRRTGPATTHLNGGSSGPAGGHLNGGSAGPATVHLVGGGAGPLRGDDLRLEIEVGPGATLEIRSVAAQLALPGRAHLPPSEFRISATVAPGGVLRWLPEPLIAAAGCDHVTVTRVEVAEGGSLLWRDDLVCGRHNEPSGNAVQNTTIRYAGRTVHRHDLSVGPAAPGWSEAAVLGGGRALGTLVSTPAALPAAAGPGDVAVMPLAGPGSLATAVGTDIRTVRAALDPLCERQAPADPPGKPQPQAAPALAGNPQLQAPFARPGEPQPQATPGRPGEPQAQPAGK